jgi:capsular exopolysaccharide synthesis family protein
MTTDRSTAGTRRLGLVAELYPLDDRHDSTKRTWPIPGANELFRSLYTGFDTGPGISMAICSAVQGEGKTTMSLGLAIAIAQDRPDRRVVVVETDLWRAVLARDFGLPPAPGLVDCLLDRQTLERALRPTSFDNLSLLVAGSEVASPQRLLRSARMPEVLAALRRTHDVVIVDTPAALAHSETSLIARMVEEVVFVVRTGVTPSRELGTALNRVQGANLRGIVVNDARSAVPDPFRRLVRL